MSSFILGLALLLGGAQAKATINQTPAAAPEPHILHASSSTAIQVPAFGHYGDAKCDGSGNTFYRPDAPTPGSVLKISEDGSQATLYLLPPEYSGSLVDVSVDPSGVVHDLLMTKEGSVAVEFDRDGPVKSKTQLSVPEYVSASRFAVFNDGAVIYVGHTNRLASEDQRGKSYMALFDPSGKLVRELSDRHAWSAGSPERPPDGAIAVAQDGNAYVLSSDTVTVLSESGEVVRKIPFQKPRPQESATRLDVSAGLLSIGLTYFVDKAVATEYLVTTTDGEKVGLYQPSSDLGDSVVCFSADSGFTFLKEGSGAPILVRALPMMFFDGLRGDYVDFAPSPLTLKQARRAKKSSSGLHRPPVAS
jgi:hypothetical protein